MKEVYLNQVRLLLRVLPVVAQESCFALKGGTAINFFIRDFPRLSVDIDLAYLPLEKREASLNKISQGIHRIEKAVHRFVPNSQTEIVKGGGAESKLLIRTQNALIKIEVNTIIRGTVYPVDRRELSEKLQNRFGQSATIQTLSIEDLYAGKLCAALDRQHPRDLFDIMLLLQNEGLSQSIKTALIAYIISHSRPINELLNPNTIRVDELYLKEFNGMTDTNTTLADLKEVQSILPNMILSALTASDKEFILSAKRMEPNWELFPLSHIKDLPAVKWKLFNLKKMSPEKHKQALNRLEKILSA
jgi:predicted nucleotidyltransferase component of viral defense system